jgi:hypothetical protein
VWGTFFPKRLQDDMDRVMILSPSDESSSPANQFHAETAVCNFDVESGERNVSVGAKTTAFRGVTKRPRAGALFEVGRRRADLSRKRTKHEARYGMRDPPPTTCSPFASKHHNETAGVSCQRNAVVTHKKRDNLLYYHSYSLAARPANGKGGITFDLILKSIRTRRGALGGGWG